MSDDFLQFLKETGRGRFKVYLGMAAGVGKTVATLYRIYESRQQRLPKLDSSQSRSCSSSRATSSMCLSPCEPPAPSVSCPS